MKRLKILVIINKFGETHPKHKHKYDMINAIENFAEVRYWHYSGDIRNIIKEIDFEPDFIFHYDIAWFDSFAPPITGLDKIDIPKGCFVIDTHWYPERRIDYFEKNSIDIIFSAGKSHFLKTFPQYKEKFRWLPFAINPNVIKDWKQEKEIDFLLMGLVYTDSSKYRPWSIAPKGRYSLREAVLNKMENHSGFVYIPHPGHLAPASRNPIVNEKYAQKISQAKMFFTCGGEFEYMVAKFFEIPGCKTLLLAKPNKDMLELGFEDQVNFVACNEDDFYDKALFYLRDYVARKTITTNGYEFIHNNHTNEIRAKEFINYIEDYLN